MRTRFWISLVCVTVPWLLVLSSSACAGADKTTADRSALVSTLAGQPGSSGTAADFSGPADFGELLGIACDRSGNLYVAEGTRNIVCRITPAGRVTTLAGMSTTPANEQASFGFADGRGATARFFSPSGIVCDAAGDLYVADAGNCTIRKITAAGAVTTLAGEAEIWGNIDGSAAAARFYWPDGITRDKADNLYVTESDAGVIRKISAAGHVSTFAGSFYTPYAESPYGKLVDSIDGWGSAARFGTPGGIACDAAGNLYVTDGTAVRKITPSGQVTTLAGKSNSPGSVDGIGPDARFKWLNGIACDAAGDLFVTDDTLIRKITPAGNVTTVAGKPGSSGNADGGGDVARFNEPQGIACDAAGNLYVADGGNSNIRKISWNP